MKRRAFIAGSAATVGSFVVLGGAKRLGAQDSDKSKLSRIAIMSRSFNPVLKSAAHPDDPKRSLEILDFADIVSERYGVHFVEFQHSDFASTEAEYLSEFRNRLLRAKSQANQINVEFGTTNISSPDFTLRLEAIDLAKMWIDHAAMIGCPRVMLNQGSLAPEMRPAAIDALKKIDAYARTKNVYITLENRDDGGQGEFPRAPWDVVVNVIKAAGIWANPDVGNFPDEQARAAGLRALYPLSSGSSHCHYDPRRFNEADAMTIAKNARYEGLFSIEAEGYNGPDPYASVQTILDELLRII